MDEVKIRKKATTGVFWKFAERFIAQLVSLVVSLVIARLLDPSDYGVVSIVTIFFTFANVIISGGLNTALIQKKDADKSDYNTVFSVSIIASIVIYFFLFVFAPVIADLYGRNILIPIIRIMGLSLPIYAIKSVVCAYISANLDFKKFFFATIGGTVVSGIVGIILALKGFGPWALVFQQLLNTLIDTIILIIVTRLKLFFEINYAKFKGLMKYGARILLSSLLGTTYNQINPLFIGIRYTSADLSFYTKGKSLPDTISSSLAYTFSAVLFPMLSKFQDRKEKLLYYTRMYMKIASFLVFPAMLGFASVADNFVLVALGSKWLPAVYYIRIVCLSSMFDVVAAGNCETIKAMGRSDIFLRMEVIKKTGYFIIIAFFIFLSNSPETLAISILFCTALQILVNSIPNRKLINYRFKYQLADLLPNFLSSLIMAFVVLIIGTLPLNPIVLLLLQIFAGMAVYLILSFVTHNKALILGYQLLKGIRK